MSEAKRKEEIERAHKARQVLQNPIYVEAWDNAEASLMSYITDPDSSDEQVLEARRTLKCLKAVRAHINTTIDTGKMAEIQLERSTHGTA